MNHRTTHIRVSTRTSRAALIALVALGLGAAGCRTTPTAQSPLSESAVHLDLPLVHQDALYDCGLASISALCQYWGIRIGQDERTSLARTADSEAGLSGGELRLALERLGFEVFLFEGRLDRTSTGLFGHVDAGRPLLVMLSPDGTAHHYGLVLGYDEARGNLILLDPMKGEILMPVAVFERNWARCRRFTLLACPKAPLPDPESESTANDADATGSNTITRSRN